jgi:Xaa-Pro aminopeptidase
MSIASETMVGAFPTGSLGADEGPGRRLDIDAKQAHVAALLERNKCDGLLVLDPDNFAWLTSGAIARAVVDPAALPALYFSPDARWLIAANATSQRLFDEEIDGLGFQLKEWPWWQGRQQLLADLCQNRTVACDVPFGNLRVVGPELRLLRRTLTPYEQACLRLLGQVVTHALEATCRTMAPGETEREVAGQMSHRLIHRGTLPLHLGVAADGRSRVYPLFGFTSTPVEKYAVLSVTARKYGLCAVATRSVSFGPPDDTFRAEHNAACKVGATYVASTWPDALPREILAAGRRVYALTGHEHEWRQAPQGHVTGRSVVELALTLNTEELFQDGWAVSWSAAVGAARSCDTFLVTDAGPRVVTPTEPWPLKRIRIQGADFVRPDILQR